MDTPDVEKAAADLDDFLKRIHNDVMWLKNLVAILVSELERRGPIPPEVIDTIGNSFAELRITKKAIPPGEDFDAPC